jgi:molybdenum cofactor cytidylyltransferase
MPFWQEAHWSKKIYRTNILIITMVDALVLAAGLATRMGSDKMALKISGETILTRVLIQALQSRLNTIVAVTRRPLKGYELDEKSQFYHSRLVNVINDSPELGMSYSIRLGLSAIIQKSVSVMIILADQIYLNFSVINTLISNSLDNPDKIIAPVVRGRRTNPVIFPAEFFPALNEITGDRGGREILRLHRRRIKTVELGKEYDDYDVDTQSDYYKVSHQVDKLIRDL